MKIALLGPFYPYKGGVMQFTTQASRALSKKHEVINISYKLQYPKILFPRGNQKDYNQTQLKIENVNYWLNTINPFSCIGTAKKINKIKPNAFIFNWIHPYFAPSLWLLCKFLNKNIKIIFIIHNVFPHEKFPLQKLLTKAVFTKANSFIVMSNSEEERLKNLLGNSIIKKFYLPNLITPPRKLAKNFKYNYICILHPVYNLLNINNKITIQEARGLLKIQNNNFVILFFGYIREYKGLKILLKAYPDIVKNITDTVLLICGEFNKSEKEEYLTLIKEAERHGGKIITAGDYIPDSEVNKYFIACDVLLLPYLSATQSGVVANAYTYGKPVIASNVGGLPEVVKEGRTGFLVPPGDSQALADAVVKFAKIQDKSIFKEHIESELERFSWDRLVEAVEELCGIN